MSSESGTSNSDADAAVGANGVTTRHEGDVYIVADNSVGEEEDYSIGRDIVVGDDGISLHCQADIEGYDFDE